MNQTDKLFQDYAHKWQVKPETVKSVYVLVESNGGKYGKSHRELEGLGIDITTRQIRYFYKKVRLHQRLDVNHKGKPENYRELLRKL